MYLTNFIEYAKTNLINYSLMWRSSMKKLLIIFIITNYIQCKPWDDIKIKVISFACKATGRGNCKEILNPLIDGDVAISDKRGSEDHMFLKTNYN